MLSYKKLKFSLVIGITLVLNSTSFAHCDSFRGPVVKAAETAIETGNLNHVLIWVRAEDETEIKEMFDKVLSVRKINQEVKTLADNYFFETVVRIHRMGEGVAYTGLKSSEQTSEGIIAADAAIEKNSIDAIISHLESEHHNKVKTMFAELQSKKNFEVNNLKAGRDFVAAYVHFIHFVEGLFQGQSPSEHNHHH